MTALDWLALAPVVIGFASALLLFLGVGAQVLRDLDGWLGDRRAWRARDEVDDLERAWSAS